MWLEEGWPSKYKAAVTNGFQSNILYELKAWQRSTPVNIMAFTSGLSLDAGVITY